MDDPNAKQRAAAGGEEWLGEQDEQHDGRGDAPDASQPAEWDARREEGGVDGDEQDERESDAELREEQGVTQEDKGDLDSRVEAVEPGEARGVPTESGAHVARRTRRYSSTNSATWMARPLRPPERRASPSRTTGGVT